MGDHSLVLIIGLLFQAFHQSHHLSLRKAVGYELRRALFRARSASTA